MIGTNGFILIFMFLIGWGCCFMLQLCVQNGYGSIVLC